MIVLQTDPNRTSGRIKTNTISGILLNLTHSIIQTTRGSFCSYNKDCDIMEM